MVAITHIVFQIPIAIFHRFIAPVTNPQATAKLPSIIIKVSTIGLCSEIQLPTLVNTSASPFKTSTIIPPV